MQWHKNFTSYCMRKQWKHQTGKATPILMLLIGLNFGRTADAQSDTNVTASSAITTTTSTTEHNDQQVYRMNYLFSAIFSAVAAAANLYTIPTFIHGKKDLTDQELAQLKAKTKNDINSFDRWALDQDPSQRDKFYNISDITLPSLVVLSGASLLLDKRIRQDWKPIFMMYYENACGDVHAI